MKTLTEEDNRMLAKCQFVSGLTIGIVVGFCHGYIMCMTYIDWNPRLYIFSVVGMFLFILFLEKIEAWSYKRMVGA